MFYEYECDNTACLHKVTLQRKVAERLYPVECSLCGAPCTFVLCAPTVLWEKSGFRTPYDMLDRAPPDAQPPKVGWTPPSKKTTKKEGPA